jgi:hypothetical protein
MKIGDLVYFGYDKTVGVVLEVKENGDCRVLFGGQIYLCVQHSLEVINASR